jgi:hypothetical protein
LVTNPVTPPSSPRHPVSHIAPSKRRINGNQTFKGGMRKSGNRFSARIPL